MVNAPEKQQQQQQNGHAQHEEQQRNGRIEASQLPNLMHHINEATRQRQPNMLKKMYPYLEMPEMVSLGGGLPHPSTFPILQASFTLPTPPNFDGTPYVQPKANGHGAAATPKTAGRTTMGLYKGIGPNGERGALDLAAAQQYARPMGYLPLIESLRRLTDLLHNPPYEYAQIPTGGNTDATTKVFRALLETDDTLLVEDFQFAPPIAAARALGAGVRGMQIDTKGVVPEALDELLSTWDTKLKGKKPHVMYTVPTGQNPSSASMTLERAKAVYAVARKHDLIIVEDDPYYTLCMDPYVRPASDGVPSTPTEPGRVALKDVHDLESFAKSLPRTYLSIDVDARVLRLDSFSKCFAPGMRLGWMTGSPAFIERIQRIAETDSQEVNGVTQAFFAQLLAEPHLNDTNESWGMEGFARWICDIRRQYQSKRDRLVNGIAASCSKDFIRCKPVAASGMFLWLDVNLEKHPEYRTDVRETRGNPTGPRTNTNELMQRLFELAIEENVLVLQSSIFASAPSFSSVFAKTAEPKALSTLKNDESQVMDGARFLRACFAGNHEQLELAAVRLGKAVQRFFGQA